MARALLSLLLIAPVAGCAGPERARPAAPVRILFDTDLQTDCDDAGALAILHALADAGEAEILGLVVSSGDPWAAGCADAINTWYGRPDLPVGRTLRALAWCARHARSELPFLLVFWPAYLAVAGAWAWGFRAGVRAVEPPYELACDQAAP